VRIPGTEDHLRAALRKTAARAAGDGVPVCLELVDVLDRYRAHGE
jgi:hypothetical protein